jgi:starvation-inducible DNA-binding protein
MAVGNQIQHRQEKRKLMEELIAQAKIVLANHYAFYLKAQNYHWNVTGPDFSQYHDLFSKIYNEVGDTIDNLAEQVRAMDSYVPASFSRFSELAEIEDELNVPPPLEMIRRLYNDIAIMQNSIMQAYHLAEQHMQHGYSNLMAERQDAFLKHAWMLRSTLKI